MMQSRMTPAAHMSTDVVYKIVNKNYSKRPNKPEHLSVDKYSPPPPKYLGVGGTQEVLKITGGGGGTQKVL